MNTAVLTLLLLLPASGSIASSAEAGSDPAVWLKLQLDRDWQARTDDKGNVEVSSPSYPMPFNQGCVIHRLFFPSHDGRPIPGDMVAYDLYFAFAAGETCADIRPERFFGIEPGNDVTALLEFARRLKAGPQPGRDIVPKGAAAAIAQCFAAEAMNSTRITHTYSWGEKGPRHDRYQVVLSCAAVDQQGEIVASGSQGDAAIRWQLRTWGGTAVDSASRSREP